MAGFALQDILGHMPLTKALRTKASGVPNPFPDEFFQVEEGNRVIGDRAKYIRISGERRTSKRGKYGAPAVRRSLRDIGDQAVRMLHNYESFPIDFTVMQQLRAFEQYTQDQGMDWVRYQLDEAAKRQQNTRTIMVGSVLRHGAIYWDSNGNLLPNSSGADSNLTVSFSIPATHQNQINGIVTIPWSLPNADIPLDIDNIRQFSLQETGLEINAALYGINVASYIRRNNFAQAFMSRNSEWNGQFLRTNEIPDGLFGIKKWIPVWKSFFETDDNGTIAEVWDDDLVVFMPNVDQPDKMTWYSMYEGSFPVPKTIDVQKASVSAATNYSLEYGMFSYGMSTISPPGHEIYYGDTFLPAIKNEKAIFQVDTTF